MQAAFVTEPAFDHFFKRAYEQHARTFFAYLLDLRLDGGIVWVEEADGRVVSASMWDPPGGATVPQHEQDARVGEDHSCDVPPEQ